MGNSRRHNRLNCDTVLFHSVCFSHFIAVVSICRGRILIHFIKSGAHKMWCALFTYSSLVSLICFSVCVDFFSRTGMGASWCLFSCLKKKNILQSMLLVASSFCPSLFICATYHIYHRSPDQCVPSKYSKKPEEKTPRRSHSIFFFSFFRLWFVCLFLWKSHTNREIALKACNALSYSLCVSLVRSLFFLIHLSIDRALDSNYTNIWIA